MLCGIYNENQNYSKTIEGDIFVTRIEVENDGTWTPFIENPNSDCRIELNVEIMRTNEG